MFENWELGWSLVSCRQATWTFCDSNSWLQYHGSSTVEFLKWLGHYDMWREKLLNCFVKVYVGERLEGSRSVSGSSILLLHTQKQCTARGSSWGSSILISDHRRLLDPPWGRVAKPLVSPLGILCIFTEQNVVNRKVRSRINFIRSVAILWSMTSSAAL